MWMRAYITMQGSNFVSMNSLRTGDFVSIQKKLLLLIIHLDFSFFFKFVLKTCFYKLHLSELDNTIFSIIIYVQWYCKFCYYFTVPCKFSLWVVQKDSFLQLGGASLSYGPLKIFYVSTALILYNASTSFRHMKK